MQYVLLVYEDDAERVRRMDEWVPHCGAYVEAMRRAGIYVAGERLRGSAAATTVRVTDAGTQVWDGPQAEAKQQLGAFHVIDVPDLDAALAWAARCPSVGRGAVEVRPGEPVRRGLGSATPSASRRRVGESSAGIRSRRKPAEDPR